MKYKIGTRGSKLALKQTMDVIAKLEQLYPEDEFEADHYYDYRRQGAEEAVRPDRIQGCLRAGD